MLALFGLELITGISLMWCLLPRAQVTAGFFRIQMLVVLGLSVLVFVSTDLPPLNAWKEINLVRLGSGLIIMTSFIGSVVWALGFRHVGTVPVFAVLALATFTLLSPGLPTGVPAWLTVLSSFATATSLGGAVTGMLLGHWYLTAPTMSITPLTRLTWLFLGALVVRLAVSAIGFLFAGDALHGSLPWTWFALRWLAGILGPLVLCGMTLRILRYRNTQAATGVLFAAVILVFIGEMSATLLLSALARPL